MTTVLAVEHLTVSYAGAVALSDVSLDVPAGKATAVLGGNGAGKTTLLSTIAGLFVPNRRARGTVTLHDNNVLGQPAHRIARQGLSLVPEGRRLFPMLSVEENLLLGSSTSRLDTDERRCRLSSVYERFPELYERRSRAASVLSGGEQQRCAIGRALMAKPAVLALDEPSTGLAPNATIALFALLRTLVDEGTTVLLVEQHAHLALEFADYVVVLDTGSVAISGPVDEVRTDPRLVRAYLG